MSLLSAIEGSSDDTVELEVDSRLKGVARWTDRGVKQVLPFDAAPLDATHTLPLVSDGCHPLPTTFLAALHECGRTTEPDPARYALNRVQIRGSTGQVIGTDGKAALLCQGFVFPFPDDVLVPALPVFGMRELTAAPDVRIGRTAKHLTVAAGAWCVRLSIDHTGRFPDITGVLPKSAPTVIAIDERDATLLLDRLPVLPGAASNLSPVTLDVEDGVVVRARQASTAGPTTIRLGHSTATGPPVRIALDRRYLARAMTLGCHTLRIAAPDKPLVAEGAGRTLVVVLLDHTLVLLPDASARRSRSAVSGRSSAMKLNETDGQAEPPGGAALDPLVEAEALRAALAEATQRAGRLVALLRNGRKEKKALATVFAGLKQLNLAPGGTP